MQFIEPTIVKYAYFNILKINLKQRAEEFGLGRDSYFLPDNDPKHTAGIVLLKRFQAA